MGAIPEGLPPHRLVDRVRSAQLEPGSLKVKLAGAAAIAVALQACTPAPVRTSQASDWIASPNYGERRPNFVVIHHTSGYSAAHALEVLTDPLRGVSAHYLIGRDGRLYQLVDERARAFHAGASYWGGETDLNSSSIGIELDNRGDEPFAEPQLVVLLALLADLRERHQIPAANFIGHGDIAPGRKSDPSRFFPWKRLAEQGFGLWCDSPAAPAPGGMSSLLALQAFGYDVSEPASALAAFRRHFRAEESGGGLEMTEEERGVLNCLVERKRR